MTCKNQYKPKLTYVALLTFDDEFLLEFDPQFLPNVQNNQKPLMIFEKNEM